MQQLIKDQRFDTLLALYNQEIDTLKEKLLNGESWENLANTRRNITELAIVLHKSHDFVAPQRINLNHPAEFPQSGEISAHPAQNKADC